MSPNVPDEKTVKSDASASDRDGVSPPLSPDVPEVSPLPPPGRFCRWPKGRQPTDAEREMLKKRNKPKADQRVAHARRTYTKHDNAVQKARSKLEWAEKNGRQDLMVRRRQQLDRALRLRRKAKAVLNKYEPIAALADHFEPTPEQLERNQKQAERWQKESKDFEKGRRRRLRTGEDGAEHEGLYQFERGYGQNPARNVRHDVLELLKSKGRIDTFEKEAGDKFKDLYLLAKMPGARGVDYERPYAPSGPGIPFAEAMTSAKDALARIKTRLGDADYSLLVKACVDNMLVSEIARELDGGSKSASKTKRSELYVGRRLCDALSQLVRIWSIRGKSSDEIKGWRAEDAKPEHRPDLHGMNPSLDTVAQDTLNAVSNPKSRQQ